MSAGGTVEIGKAAPATVVEESRSGQRQKDLRRRTVGDSTAAGSTAGSTSDSTGAGEHQRRLVHSNWKAEGEPAPRSHTHNSSMRLVGKVPTREAGVRVLQAAEADRKLKPGSLVPARSRRWHKDSCASWHADAKTASSPYNGTGKMGLCAPRSTEGKKESRRNPI